MNGHPVGIPGQGDEDKNETEKWQEEKRPEEKRQGREDKNETEKWEQGKDKKH
jgi:hypothetical protein